MSQNRFVYNQVYTVSVPKKELTELACNKDLSKKDLRVCLLLFTKLDGYKIGDKVTLGDGRLKDPMNYNRIDIESIAETLGLKKKEVKASIETLIEQGIIEEGSTTTIKNGYRFTF